MMYANIAYALMVGSLGYRYMCHQNFLNATNLPQVRLWRIAVLIAMLLLGFVPVQSLSFFDYLSSLFGEPAILTLLLCLHYCLPKAYRLNKTSLAWLFAMTIVIICSALSLLGFHQSFLDFYYHSLYVHGLVLMVLFLPAYILDKKVIVLMWGVLVAYALSFLQSGHMLHYVADFWLFVWAFIWFCKNTLGYFLGKY